MISFSSWETEIAQITELSEYQNATIQILDPSLLTKTYSYDDNDYTITGDAVIYDGQARIQPSRSAREINSITNDPNSAKTVIIQIPSTEVIEIKRGFQVRVTDGGRNPSLENMLFTVMADVDSSHMASHTFEAIVNVDVEPNWD